MELMKRLSNFRANKSSQLCLLEYDGNPHFTITSELIQPVIILSAEISSAGIVGPQFFDGTVAGENYRDKMKTVIMPALKQRPDFNNLYFQQNGAPPIFATVIRNVLTNRLAGQGPLNFLYDLRT